MTKRVLSLLLALVMALSLCVPAFAAEAPVDEAEEVGAEVVDAPAEVAVDEPAAAVADAEHLDDRALQGAVDKATDMEPGVIAGEYQYGTGAWPTDMDASKGETHTIAGSCTYFMNKLAAARQVLASITSHGGYDTWITIPGNSAIYETALKGLQDAVNLLTKYVRSEQITDLQDWERWYKKVIAENEADSYGTGDYDTQPWFEEAVEEALAFQQGMSGYAGGTYANALYKDYVTAEATHKTLDENSNLALRAEYHDYIELRDAIADARAKLAGDAWFDLGLYYDSSVKVKTGHEDLTLAMDAIDNYFSSSSATGFIAGVTLEQVHFWLDTIKEALQENKHVLKIDFFYITPDFASVEAVVENFEGWKEDCRDYHLQISCGDVVLNGNPFSAIKLANSVTGNEGKFGATAAQLGIPSGDNKLKDGSVITVKLICDKGNHVVDERTITVDQSYNGPKFQKAVYTASADTITVTLSKSMHDANGGTAGSHYDQNQYAAATLTLKYNGTTVEKHELTEWERIIKFNLKPVNLGDYTIELSVKGGQQSGGDQSWVIRDTITATVPDITAYVGKAGTDATWKLAGATGYPNLLLAIEKASNTDGLYAKNGLTDLVKALLEKNLAPANAIVAESTTLPDCAANEKRVDAAIEALYGILKDLEEAADATALKTAIANGEALVPSDYDNAADWKALQDAIAAGKDLEKQLPLSKTAANEGKIAARAKAINDAIAKLNTYDAVYPSTELNALKELIDSVPTRLAADDFSAESKAAVNAAVAAAKPLLDKTGVKKSEVNAAIDALQTALNNLTTVKSDAAPTAPSADYTGWATAENGDYYYFKNGSLVKGDWVKSKGLWYHMGATGKMDTGFIHIVDSWGDAWYYLNPSNTKGTMGRMFTGWKMINDSSAGAWGWFETRNNGHQGQCTYTTNWGDFKNYKPF